MKKIKLILYFLMIFNFFSVSNAKYDKIAFDFKFDSINQGETVDLGDYKEAGRHEKPSYEKIKQNWVNKRKFNG